MLSHLDSISAALSVAAFVAFSGYTWIRLDSLADRAALARPGGRVKRALVRQMGAMIGWWCVAVSAAFSALYGAPQATVPVFLIGVSLIVMAVISRRRGDAPLFWGAV